MEKRSILRKKSQPPQEVKTQDEDVNIDEDIFDAVKIEEPKKKVVTPKPEEEVIVEIKPKNHMEEARKKSLEVRRKKKEEQVRLKIQAEMLVEQLNEEKKRNEELRRGQMKKIKKVIPEQEEEEEEEVVISKPKKKIVKAKAVSEDIDYNKLADMICGRLKGVEDGIREQERKIANDDYEQKLRAYEEQQKKLREQAKPKEKIPMYTNMRQKPNRAFEAFGGWRT